MLETRVGIGGGVNAADRTTVDREATPLGGRKRDTLHGGDRVPRHLSFRRALLAGGVMWASFFVLDVDVVRYLGAGSLLHFAMLRGAVLGVIVLVLIRMYRGPTPSERMIVVSDMLTYTVAAGAVALMCVDFRGLASPYVPGVCLVLLSRTVTGQDAWKRGLVMTGVPVATFFIILLGSAVLSTRVTSQFHDPAAISTFLVNVAYVLSTYVFLVVGGHIVWVLRRQVFEARSLGRYRLKSRIAAGGMGDIWLAYHPGLKRDVAVKILRPDAIEKSPHALARFEQEISATTQLAHPNTIRIFDFGTTEDGLWYYVMELLEGETIAEVVSRTGPLAPARAIHIVGQAARALGEAHEHGIVHRDVKPENIFLTALGGEHDFVKVLDFGIAKVQNPEVAMTVTGSVLGTPAYISPEVAVGRPADVRSDVYGLGIVLYFMLCGKPPFEGETPGAVLLAHASQLPPSPSGILGRRLPADVETVVMRALEKDPVHRYANAAEFALALAACTQAGSWTFGDALVARRSSRPPTSGVMEAALSLAAPRVPSEWVEHSEESPHSIGAKVPTS